MYECPSCNENIEIFPSELVQKSSKQELLEQILDTYHVILIK
jgi:hypothetical protein